MSDTAHPSAALSRPGFDIELHAENAFTRGVVRVRRVSADTRLEERDVVLVLRKAGVRLTDEVKQRVAEGVAKVNVSEAVAVSFVAVEGVAPAAGTDAELRWAVDVVPRSRPHSNQDGRADFRDLEDSANVAAGQLLLTVVPAVRGTPGRDIFGDVIRPKTGQTADVRPGRNVTVSDDGTQYFARRDGRVRFAHGVLSVESVYEIHGSVDYAVGNVDFKGPVIVHGDVRAGFEVRSGDWIEVYGSVEGARVFAKGDVHVRSGVNGRGRCRIECGGSFCARYLNGATVEAGGDVEVIRSVLHSRVLCGGKFRIVTQGARASTIIAGGDVDIPVIGSRRAVEVEVAAGMDVEREMSIRKVGEALAGRREEHEQLRRELGSVAGESARVVEIYPAGKRARLAELLRRYHETERDCEELAAEHRRLLEDARRDPEAVIKVSRHLWRGATLQIADARHTVGQSRRGPLRYVAHNGRLTTA